MENAYAFSLLFQKSEQCCVVHLFAVLCLGRILRIYEHAVVMLEMHEIYVVGMVHLLAHMLYL
jgi:hypothetical protein